jgi:shikimate kinase
MRLHRTIALIGLSGVGKSTLSAPLAAAFGCPANDTDALVVAAVGCSIDELFAAQGEAAFRDHETAALAAALAGPPQILATGGGIVLRDANRERLRTQATVIWLDAPDTVILARLAAHAERRPLLATDPAARLAALRQARAPLYQELAQLILDTSSAPPDVLVQQIIDQL